MLSQIECPTKILQPVECDHVRVVQVVCSVVGRAYGGEDVIAVKDPVCVLEADLAPRLVVREVEVILG